MTPDQAQRIERCDREIEHCIRCQCEADNQEQRLGAMHGEMDWRWSREEILEEVARLR